MEELALQAELQRAVGAEVQLVRLEGASVLAAYQIARDGQVIVAVDRRDWLYFQVRAGREYLDMGRVLERAGERFRARLAGESS